MTNTSKYFVSIQFTPNEQYKSEIHEKFYIETALGKMWNPNLSSNAIIQLHDLAILIDEMHKLSNSSKYVALKQTLNTDFGRFEIKMKTFNRNIYVFYIALLTTLISSLVISLYFFLI
jgi:hypothetical protein